MTDKSFHSNWEDNIYAQGKHLNRYPYDLVVSIVANKLFHLPKEERGKIKILDLGCGVGNHAKFFAENGFSVYGLDGSRSAIDICHKRFKEWGLEGDFVQGDFLDLPYEDDFFGLVLDRESLSANKISDIKNTIKQVYKKLKPGGVFVSFVYSLDHPDIKFGRMAELNTYTDFSAGSFHQTGVIHVFDKKEILESYSDFKIENIMHHLVKEVKDDSKKFIEFAEYIIIAKK